LLGVLLLAGGLFGLVYQALLGYRVIVLRRKRAEELARRRAVRAERRERNHAQRLHQIAERDRAAAAELLRREKSTKERRQRLANEMLESETSAIRDAAIHDRVKQLQSQSHSELATSAASTLAFRGWQVSIPDMEAPFDMQLERTQSDQNLRYVARCVPPECIADLPDLNALDDWREHESAEHGYLISTQGFSERLVTEYRLRPVPITLVEAHILALWSEH
jgi:hypothetical protein